MKFDLSIVVPCYNVSSYLDRFFKCLESQLDESISIEFVFVNDASTDSTIDKLRQFAAVHNNVVIIDKATNQGISAARNSGMDIARGKWVTFPDPDDVIIGKGYYYLFHNFVAKDASLDAVSFEMDVVKEKDYKFSPDLRCEDGRLVWEGTGYDFFNHYHMGLCSTLLYRLDVIKQNKLLFENYKVGEDSVFNTKFELKCNKVAKVTSKIYTYVLRKNSITHSQSSSLIKERISAEVDVARFFYGLEKASTDITFSNRCLYYKKSFCGLALGQILRSNISIKEIKRFKNTLSELNVTYKPIYFIKSKESIKARGQILLISFPLLLLVVRPLYKFIIRDRL
ncbi:MAG: glycosyltransferase [Bacteroidales bacterium]|nr:glycosyltransferase [Bacteroidales bacterium]